MPGTTTRGYPYAEPTDPLVQWPATSRTLAEAIDANHRTVIGGSHDISSAGSIQAKSAYTFKVTFPTGVFTTAPAVAAVFHRGSTIVPGYLNPTELATFGGFPKINAIVSGLTAESFNVTVYTEDALDLSGTFVQWVAVARG